MSHEIRKFNIYIEENGRYMDESCRRLHLTCNSYEEAIRECRYIVEDSVREFFDYNFTRDENYNLFQLYGVSPWFDANGCGDAFSAPDYAKEYINNLFEWKCFLD